jgi:hypothetical protein
MTAFCGLFNPGRDSTLFICCHTITSRCLNPLHVSASLLHYCISGFIKNDEEKKITTNVRMNVAIEARSLNHSYRGKSIA